MERATEKQRDFLRLLQNQTHCHLVKPRQKLEKKQCSTLIDLYLKLRNETEKVDHGLPDVTMIGFLQHQIEREAKDYVED